VTATAAPLVGGEPEPGPSPDRVAFDVPSEPQPQGSSRAFRHRHTGRVMVTSDNARLRPWRDAVCWHARQAMHTPWLIGTVARPPFEGPVAVVLEFRFARPAGHFGKRGLPPSAPSGHVVRPDLDKLVRAVLDALSEAGVWRDDAQVVSIAARKAYGSAPGLTAEIVRSESLASPRVANDEG